GPSSANTTRGILDGGVYHQYDYPTASSVLAASGSAGFGTTMDAPTDTLPMTMTMAPLPEWGTVSETDNSVMMTSTASPPPSFAAASRPLSP
ncbi:unnamed protein product, partial [Ectocarpus sp. 12 AP-2014]